MVEYDTDAAALASVKTPINITATKRSISFNTYSKITVPITSSKTVVVKLPSDKGKYPMAIKKGASTDLKSILASNYSTNTNFKTTSNGKFNTIYGWTLLSNGNYGYFYRLANPTGGVYNVTINAAINATQSSLVYDGYSSCTKQQANTANYTVFSCICSLA